MTHIAPITETNLEDLLPHIWRNGNNWTDHNLTVSFPSAPTPYWINQGMDPIDFTALLGANQTYFIRAMQLWADLADITITNLGTGNTGEIRGFGWYQPGASWAGKVGSSPGFDINMDVQINTAKDNGDGTYTQQLPDQSPNTSGFYLLLHEIGHTLGLDQTGNYDAGQGVTYEVDAEYTEDTRQYTVMSYFGEWKTDARYWGNAIDAPLLHDIYTIQQI